jgi:predicted membrane protein
MAKGALKYLLYALSAVLIFLGFVFMISYNLGVQYFVIGIIFIGIAILIIYSNQERRQVEIKQTLEVSGAPKLKEIKCPNCGAILDPTTVQVIDGKPFMTCKYCGNKFEITEEPKW